MRCQLCCYEIDGIAPRIRQNRHYQHHNGSIVLMCSKCRSTLFAFSHKELARRGKVK